MRALSVAILVTGTRGDAQPFIALGLRLQAYGHRVRLATHEAYRAFVTSSGLEFYPLGGDPAVLSEFVVSNRGIVPRHLAGAVGSTREVRAVVFSCLPACTAPDPGPPGAGAEPGPAFTAEAIIANPPCYGHIHVAEKLDVPLHMAFTMPWTPTAAFPSPLTNAAKTPSGTLNRLSYRVVDDFINLGLGSVINDFRTQALGLPPLVAADNGGSLVWRCRVPFTYCFSPALVPKPADWPAWVDVAGYWVLPAATSQAAFTPAPELEAFLAAGAWRRGPPGGDRPSPAAARARAYLFTGLFQGDVPFRKSFFTQQTCLTLERWSQAPRRCMWGLVRWWWETPPA